MKKIYSIVGYDGLRTRYDSVPGTRLQKLCWYSGHKGYATFNIPGYAGYRTLQIPENVGYNPSPVLSGILGGLPSKYPGMSGMTPSEYPGISGTRCPHQIPVPGIYPIVTTIETYIHDKIEKTPLCAMNRDLPLFHIQVSRSTTYWTPRSIEQVCSRRLKDNAGARQLLLHSSVRCRCHRVTA